MILAADAFFCIFEFEKNEGINDDIVTTRSKTCLELFF